MSQRLPGNPRIGILVVAYNAASTLHKTLERIPADFRSKIDEIFVLDDASDDDTHLHAQSWAQGVDAPKTLVIRHKKNLGYGGNQKAGYQLAIERNLDIVVLLHGDGQYAPEMLPQMVDPLIKGDADAVFGSRMLHKGAARKGGMPFYKRVGNRILTAAENKLLGTNLSEFHSGYRAYNVHALKQIPFGHNTDEFDFDTQIIIQLVHADKKIVEIPIPTYYGDEICYVNGMKYAKDVMLDMLEYRMAVKGFGTSEWIESPQEYGFKEGDGSSHAVILGMLKDMPSSRILDLGCAGGLLAEAMRREGHHVTGVDYLESPGIQDRVDAFFQADLAAGIPPEVGEGYDLVIAGDVIEHLPRPTHTLREMLRVLRPSGQLILSVPNVGHWYPRMRFATGLFGYDRRGILDNTHLRFFTRRMLRRLVKRCGFDILQEEVTGLPLGVLSPGESRMLKTARGLDNFLVKLRPTFFGYQFVMRLVPHAEEAVVVEGI